MIEENRTKKLDTGILCSRNNFNRTYNLQFFADGPGGEKTEEASPKKIADARKEGQVAKSMELVSGATLITFFFVLRFLIGNLSDNLVSSFPLFYKYIDVLAKEEISSAIVGTIIQDVSLHIIKISLPIIGIIFAIIILVNIIQVKPQITTKPLGPKLDMLNPVNGFKRMFSKDKIVVLIKDILKVFLVMYIAYSTLISELDALINLYDMDLMQAIVYIGDLVLSLGISIGIMYMMLGIVDLFYQKFKFKRDLRMTKQEVKEELKQTDGNPQIKSRQRSKMREVSARRMMQSIPEADVVITNPTHFAVAIKYDTELGTAPLVLAKGADFLAAKIKERAKENKVPIVENKPLARMLYFNVEIGEEIPPELYELTAQVLAYVYSLNGEGPNINEEN